jgi:LemA protein
MEIPLVLLLALLFIAGVYLALTYNRLVALRNYIRDAWANIDTELKRRYDLIPNLVATVKGYAAHEKEILERVTLLRSRCMSELGNRGRLEAEEGQLVEALQKLMVVVENYPLLKADQNFLQLQHELVNTENRIQAARRFFNGNVRDYRNTCEKFPSSMVASAFGFEPEDFFNVESAIREVPSAKIQGHNT